MRERDCGRIALRLVHFLEESVFELEILFAVEERSSIYTDKNYAYSDLDGRYSHDVGKHKRGEFVNESITSNSTGSVWAIVKRAHKGE